MVLNLQECLRRKWRRNGRKVLRWKVEKEVAESIELKCVIFNVRKSIERKVGEIDMRKNIERKVATIVLENIELERGSAE